MPRIPTGRKSYHIRLLPKIMTGVGKLAVKLNTTTSAVIEDACAKRLKEKGVRVDRDVLDRPRS